jgi:antitoxin VapB
MNAVTTSKTFKSGNSEAIRLPKGLGFGIGTEVRIEREGGRLVLTPASDPIADQARLDALLDDLAAIGTPPDGVQEREPIEWPERPGL